MLYTVAGHLLGGVSEPILLRAFEYWKHIDTQISERIESRPQPTVLICGPRQASGMAPTAGLP